jgi:hypothetical protein
MESWQLRQRTATGGLIGASESDKPGSVAIRSVHERLDCPTQIYLVGVSSTAVRRVSASESPRCRAAEVAKCLDSKESKEGPRQPFLDEETASSRGSKVGSNRDNPRTHPIDTKSFSGRRTTFSVALCRESMPRKTAHDCPSSVRVFSSRPAPERDGAENQSSQTIEMVEAKISGR